MNGSLLSDHPELDSIEVFKMLQENKPKYSDFIKHRSSILFCVEPKKSMRAVGLSTYDAIMIDTLDTNIGSTWALNLKKLNFDIDVIAFYSNEIIFIFEKESSKHLFEYLSNTSIIDQEREIESILNGTISWSRLNPPTRK